MNSHSGHKSDPSVVVLTPMAVNVTPVVTVLTPPLSNLTPLNVIEEAAQIRLKKSRCFSIMEAWQRQESDRMSAIHEKGGRCH